MLPVRPKIIAQAAISTARPADIARGRSFVAHTHTKLFEQQCLHTPLAKRLNKRTASSE